MRRRTTRWRLSIQQAAMIVALFGLSGLAMSIFMTIAKFRSSYHCDESMLSACTSAAFLDCDAVLASPWSTLGWSESDAYPITLLATSFYTVVIALSIPLVARRTQGVAASLLLYLAWAGALTCVPLALYAYLHVGGVCLFCACLYLINVSLLFAVMLLDRAGQRHQLAELWRPRTQRGSTLAMVGLFFVALTLVQFLSYGRAARDIGTEPRCITDVEGLPATSLTIGDDGGDAPFADFALVVDLSCEHCAADFSGWSQIAANSDGRYRLRVYPVAGDHECDIGLNFGSPSAQHHNSCTAARAVECVEERLPGRGVDLVGALFEHRVGVRGRDVAFTVDRVVDVIAVDLDVDDTDGRLRRCIDDPSPANPAHGRVLARTEVFAAFKNIRDVPATLVTFFEDDGSPLHLGLLLRGQKDYPNLDDFLERTRRQVTAEIAVRAASIRRRP